MLMTVRHVYSGPVQLAVSRRASMPVLEITIFDFQMIQGQDELVMGQNA